MMILLAFPVLTNRITCAESILTSQYFCCTPPIFDITLSTHSISPSFFSGPSLTMKIITIIQAALALTTSVASAQKSDNAKPSANSISTTSSYPGPSSSSTATWTSLTTSSPSRTRSRGPRPSATGTETSSATSSARPRPKHKHVDKINETEGIPPNEEIESAKHDKFCTQGPAEKDLCRSLNDHVKTCNPRSPKKTPGSKSDPKCTAKSSQYLLDSLLALKPCDTTGKDTTLKTVCEKRHLIESERCERHVVTFKKDCSHHHLMYLLVGWNKFFVNNK